MVIQTNQNYILNLMLSIPHFVTGAIAQFFSDTPPETVLTDVACFGNETELVDCSLTEFSTQCTSEPTDGGVICQDSATTQFSVCNDGDVRLVDGNNRLEGRVELCENNAWGTICDTEFSEDVADVICNQTGYRHNGIIT